MVAEAISGLANTSGHSLKSRLLVITVALAFVAVADHLIQILLLVLRQRSEAEIIDFALEPLDALARLALLEILEDRHGRAPTLMVSQLPVSSWHEVIGEPTIADAICDRIVHAAHRINLEGDSVRKLYAERGHRDSAERRG